MKSMFFTTAPMRESHGGGNVSIHEYNALKSVSESCNLWTLESTNIPQEYMAIPFMTDYAAAHAIEQMPKIDLAVFNGTPYHFTQKMLGCKTIVDVPAHNLEESVAEFNNLFGSYPFKHMTDPILWDWMSEFVRRADMIFSPANIAAQYTQKKLGMPPEKFRVIPHGCIIPEKYVEPPGEIILSHIGQNGPDKGQVYLVQALQSFKNTSLKIMLAGLGTERWGGMGHVQDITGIYDGSSVYIQPSVTEGFGIPVLEAMAHGRPVICSQGAGVYELITEGFNGFTFRPRHTKELEEHIKYFMDNPNEVKRMGKNALETAKLYTWEKIEHRYAQAYKEVFE